jgi:hypothetical protein
MVQAAEERRSGFSYCKLPSIPGHARVLKPSIVLVQQKSFTGVKNAFNSGGPGMIL